MVIHKSFIITLVITIIKVHVQGQTLGITNNHYSAYDGYTLFSQLADTSTFLIDNCGNIVHQWEVNSRPGNSEYLLEDGSLLRCGKDEGNTDFVKGGYGGLIEKLDWEGNYLWEYQYSNDSLRQHHDIAPLPNGNVLVLAWEKKDSANAVNSGRDPSILVDKELWPEHIVEIEPIYPNGGNIVWEWHIWDHLVQDFNNTKSNFGVINEHPELMNINAYAGNGGKDWLHGNSIDYNESLDQIMISLKTLSEIIIIDHSTTTEEAKGSTGGNSNKGGDIIYRWGNPINYDTGTSLDQKLFGQHDAHWIKTGLNKEGKIQLFNNNNPGSFSSIVIIDQPTSGFDYDLISGNSFLPNNYFWEYQSVPDTAFFSGRISSSQMLPNDHTLICEGNTGHFFEINQNKEIVWEYFTPINSGTPVDQNTSTSINNSVFRCIKYAFNYSAFNGKDLSATYSIELNPDNDWCNTQLSTNEKSMPQNLKIYPNPAKHFLTVATTRKMKKITITSIAGKKIKEIKSINSTDFSISMDDISLGSYLCIATLINGEKIAMRFFKVN